MVVAGWMGKGGIEREEKRIDIRQALKWLIKDSGGKRMGGGDGEWRGF